MSPQLAPIRGDVLATIQRIAVSSLAPTLISKTNLSISPVIFPAEHVFNLVETKLVVKQAAALVFVDLKPQANWGHPCCIGFTIQFGQSVVYGEALFPPNLAGEWSWRFSRAGRNSSDGDTARSICEVVERGFGGPISLPGCRGGWSSDMRSCGPARSRYAPCGGS